MLAVAVLVARLEGGLWGGDEGGGSGGFVGGVGDIAFGLGDPPGEHDQKHEPDQHRGEHGQLGGDCSSLVTRGCGSSVRLRDESFDRTSGAGGDLPVESGEEPGRSPGHLDTDGLGGAGDGHLWFGDVAGGVEEPFSGSDPVFLGGGDDLGGVDCLSGSGDRRPDRRATTTPPETARVST